MAFGYNHPHASVERVAEVACGSSGGREASGGAHTGGSKQGGRERSTTFGSLKESTEERFFVGEAELA
jgi:hypothetical protein